MKALAVVATLGLTLALAHCSGSKASSVTASNSSPAQPAQQNSSRASVNLCKLVTQEEVSQAMGRKSGPGEFHNDLGGRCNFYDSTSQYEIFLQNMDPASIDSLAQLGGQKAAPGIGDRAYWADGSLYVEKGNRGIQIGFSLPHASDKLSPAAEKLSKLIVSRM
jgi:hypothetical protein